MGAFNNALRATAISTIPSTVIKSVCITISSLQGHAVQRLPGRGLAREHVPRGIRDQVRQELIFELWSGLYSSVVSLFWMADCELQGQDGWFSFRCFQRSRWHYVKVRVVRICAKRATPGSNCVVSSSSLAMKFRLHIPFQFRATFS